MSGTDFAIPTEAVEPMRIALVAPPYFDIPPKGYGGTEAVVADLADALTARGHVVTLLGAGQSGTTAQRFIPLWESTVPDRLGQPYPEIMHAVKVRRAIERLAETDGIDLVHDHTFAGPLNAAVHRSLGLPTVLTMHGPIDDDLYPYYRELGTDVGLIAISDRQRELAPDLNWVGRVHNALRISDWPFRSDKGDYALFLGRYAPYKGAHLALDAAHAAGVPLVLAGKCDEPAERAYFEEYVRPRLTDKDHVFGQADAVSKRKLLAGARCLLFPVQWEEPFGMVMIEAMACGTPVVALRGGAVPEVVVDCVTGFVCDHPDELADAVAKTHTLDPAACRRHVAAHFAVGQFGSGYERIYRDVLSNAEAAKSTITLRRVVEPDTSERATA
ncbi:glycosyltransferase family 4 protein [Mycolicibacterium fortuitum]|uniref:glycosyltransferase family 4 protein n=1 Tax=Mycolicibacterium fortuitum TaxID=1766 RepID=UPI0007E9BCD6|nr:glycosyltransferase family 4 protein [Mycolicibacterium fortuitum]NOR00147.1 glycosyltransferase family 4 protein [Mycolicibacterium fortuitum]OBA97574.1 glycosyltransferase [Mycolicibacterium fortuitum]OBG51944.1 glycosyltransferase [Mycolicibacterium fortuitum]OBI74663.1 glycosyltransferase [Mycolicibacterium fortuitum]UBV24021.1 glycosyltransferase family 4 protein [Mycolicibacterium fortuitum]